MFVLQIGNLGVFQLEGCNFGFRPHERSACHHEAVEVVVTLPSTARDVDEQLSSQYARQKVNNQQLYYKIFSLHGS